MPLKRILIVQFYDRIMVQHKYWLSKDGHGVITFVAGNEPKIRERILEEVAQINPELLIIGVRPSPFPGSDWGRKRAVQFPIGLEVVELLRQTSNIPIILTHRWYADLWSELDYWDSREDYWDRIGKTRPVAVVREGDFDELQLAARLAEHIIASMESARLFSTVFEAASDALFIKDTSLRYTHVNPAMQVLFSRPASELVGKKDEDLLEPEDAKYFEELEQRVLQGESIEEQRSRLINGVVMTFLDVRVSLRGASGEIIGICGFSRDITDRQRIDFAKSSSTDEYPSLAMRDCLEKARLAAQKDTTVLLLGESGSGKDYMARYVHDNSKRSGGPYWDLNCAAVSQQIAESELFGHERGAFTGAYARKRGLLELAEGGTLLLNEIGELPLSLQAKLLTFLETKQFIRVGGEKKITVNTRLIAATNRDLTEDVEKGNFRKDLFYRLNVFFIKVPPLRERREDFPKLVEELMQQIGKEMGLEDIPYVQPHTMTALREYSWPGNVRELRNVLERGIILSDGKALNLDDISLEPKSGVPTFWSTDFPPKPSLEIALEDLRATCIQEAMRLTGNNQKRSAELLGIDRYKLLRNLKKRQT
ncbi:MAG: sigma-54 interaction domain-containing protein [Desulfomonilaceae bacterium]